MVEKTKKPPLLPCPYCGGPALVFRPPYGDNREVRCGNKQCRVAPGTGFKVYAAAVADWNTRTAPEAAGEAR